MGNFLGLGSRGWWYDALMKLLSRFDRVTTLEPWPEEWRTWAGSTDRQTGWIYLHPRTFDQLQQLEKGFRPRTKLQQTDYGFSILTLSHELAHRHGISDETKAQEEGKREYLRVAKRLGVRPILARKMKFLVRNA